jgi:hypothetical protein
MDEILVYPDNDYRSYLEHHGIPGQKWGVRKAAWYPIAAFQKASDKIGTKVHEFKQKRAAAKRKKQQVANLQKAREARAQKAKEEKDFEAEKKRILTSGTPGEVIKIAPHLTDKEVQDAMLRNANLEKLRAAEKTRIKELEDAEFAKKYEKFDKIAKTVGKATEYANTAKNALDAYNNVMKFFKDDKPTISDIDAILKNPKNYTDEQVKAAKERKANLDAMKPKEKEPEKQPKHSANVDDILSNPDKYSDDEVRDAWTRQQNLNNMRKDKADRDASTPRTGTVESEKSFHDYEQSGSKKSKVVDADFVDLTKNVSPEKVSNALTVISRAMNTYESSKNSGTIAAGKKLLESRNVAQLALEDKRDKGAGTGSLLPAPKNPNSGSGASKFLLEDKSSRTNSLGQLLLEDKGGKNSALSPAGQKLLTQKIDTTEPATLSSERINWLVRHETGK